MRFLIQLLTQLFFLIILMSTTSYTQERDRSKIQDKYKWNLTDIYSNDEAWAKAKDLFISDLSVIDKFKGTLSQSPQNLFNCLDKVSQLAKEFSRLSIYAGLSLDQDTRDSKYLAMSQEIGQIGSTFGSKAAFIEPEILSIENSKIESFLSQEKQLETYKHQIDDILRRKAHTGNAAEEKIIAEASLMSGAASNMYGIFSDADFPYESVTLSDGKTVKLDKSGFSLYRTVPVREDRKKVFETYMGKLYDFRRTFGTQLYEKIKSDIFYMKTRNYESALQSSLDANNIPVKVYHTLIDNVNANLDTFHKYLKLRKRMMGLDELHYYDLYAPLVAGVDLKYSIEESEKNITDALKPLGTKYVDVIKKAFSDRWIDFYPSDGKRAGAYSNGGVYDVHPYMLLNYNNKYDDMSTLAHELGHTMQSYLSNTSQPYPTSQYPIFTAEVASTFNEALLLDYMLRQIKDDNVKLSILGNYLEGIKGTLFRQTQFAEFELRIHEMAEKGESLTGDRLDDIYLEITKKYYGHDKGICIVDDNIKSEWSNILHFFYYSYYVYQYATSFTASSALSEKVLAGNNAATERYIKFLSAGGSDYPINLLQQAGVDMTTSEPFSLSMKKMNRVIDEMESILNKMQH
ncbi:MAG: oligoendopeptidase F [Ignavibacteriales bacterium]|nr:oligoendopeptidase F [Ignavibacteriales bacterium]